MLSCAIVVSLMTRTSLNMFASIPQRHKATQNSTCPCCKTSFITQISVRKFALRIKSSNSLLTIVAFPETNRLFIENPVTGQFQVSEGVKDLRDAQKRQDQAKVDEDDKLLEGVNGLVELSPEEELDFRTKMMALPPRPRPREKPIEETAQENLTEEWHTVTMEYRNFAFVKRMIFLIFQVCGSSE